MSHETHTPPLFHKQNILTLKDIYTLQVCKIMHQIHNNNSVDADDNQNCDKNVDHDADIDGIDENSHENHNINDIDNNNMNATNSMDFVSSNSSEMSKMSSNVFFLNGDLNFGNGKVNFDDNNVDNMNFNHTTGMELNQRLLGNAFCGNMGTMGIMSLFWKKQIVEYSEL